MVAEALRLIPLGFIVALYGTFIGAGGGFVLMPVLLLVYPDAPAESLTAISLAVVFCNATSGSVAYARLKRIDYLSGLLLMSATIPGAVIGALTTSFIPRRAFDAVLGLLMILVAAFLLWRPTEVSAEEPPPTDRANTHRLGSYSLKLGLVISFFAGYASSLLGIGGGIIHVPVLVHLLHFPVHIATATSHFILAFMTLAGTAVHLVKGTLTPGLSRVAWLAVGVVPGAQVGAWFSSRVHGRWVIRALALALGFVGVRVLVLAFSAR
jgi:uncharacterized membrane protein YfcA